MKKIVVFWLFSVIFVNLSFFFIFKGEENFSVTIIDKNQERVKDVVLFIYNQNDSYVDYIITNKNGEGSCKKLAPGNYYLLQKEEKYLNTTKYFFEISKETEKLELVISLNNYDDITISSYLEKDFLCLGSQSVYLRNLETVDGETLYTNNYFVPLEGYNLSKLRYIGFAPKAVSNTISYGHFTKYNYDHIDNYTQPTQLAIWSALAYPFDLDKQQKFLDNLILKSNEYKIIQEFIENAKRINERVAKSQYTYDVVAPVVDTSLAVPQAMDGFTLYGPYSLEGTYSITLSSKDKNISFTNKVGEPLLEARNISTFYIKSTKPLKKVKVSLATNITKVIASEYQMEDTGFLFFLTEIQKTEIYQNLEISLP